MAGGKRKQELTAETILSKISEYDIYRMYFDGVKLNRATHSPIRKDDNPSFSIRSSRKSNGIYHIDYADTEFRGNCFQFVGQLFNIRYNEVLAKIDNDFGLGISSVAVKDYQQIVKQYEQPEIVKKYVHILVVTRKFTLEELAYWNQYGICKSELKANNIYGISKVYLDRRKLPRRETQLQFAYEYGNDWKIYTPFAENKKLKWFPNNVAIDTMEGLENIQKGTENAVVTKSKKDFMVIRKFLPAVCATQNESTVAINEENMEYLANNSINKYVAFDNDEPGKKASRFYTQNCGFRHINVPDHYNAEGITDFADLTKKYGLDKVIQHFRQKNLVN